MNNVETDNTRQIVTCGFIFNRWNGVVSILACKRGKDARNNQGKWCIPGGHLQNDETTEECVQREVFEETGIDRPIDSYNLYDIMSEPNAENIICINYYQINDFVITDYDKNIKKHTDNEIECAKFIPLDNIADYEWGFSQQELISKIIEIYACIKLNNY